ncbi:hypothetical protein [Actinoplanes lobatus]|uniref:Uncharacterized protein n=1 Tax=Actinoplanes lobatus TaxID=113568 RepID=A0A7W7HJZ8_9ACTN|nr:hypothetical protein [Actinoplanes lobatus]MBB4751946.1 hypothetical protein [Actinoplanes lobatus]
MQRTIMLAATSRRGARRVGSHPIERLALGIPVADDEAGQAIDDCLAEVGRLFGIDRGSGDQAWQERHDRIRKARAIAPVRWEDLLEAVEGEPARTEPSAARIRSGFSGMVDVLAGDDDAVTDDVINWLAVGLRLPDETLDQIQDGVRAAELSGDASLIDSLKLLSLDHLRRVGRQTGLEQWRRALQVFLRVNLAQAFVALLGTLDIAGRPVDLGGALRVDAHVVNQLRTDPVWDLANPHMINLSSRRLPQTLTLGALGIIMAGQLELWETYLERLVTLTHPAPHS